jgi:hypothetical protein
MSDNHEKMTEAGLVSGNLDDHHKEALNSLSEDEGNQLVSLLKKVHEATPDDKKADKPNIF